MRGIRLAPPIVALVVAACGLLPTPSGPVIVSGTVVDAAGEPVPAAEVTLSVSDWAGAVAPGDVVQLIWSDVTTAGPDGRFVFARPIPDELRQFAGDSGIVNFDLLSVAPVTNSASIWAFPRHLDETGWVDAAPDVRLSPLGTS